MKSTRAGFILIFSLYACLSLPAQYPLIKETRVFRDDIYKQQQQETESWYFNKARGLPPPPLTMYRYVSSGADSLVMLAATFNLPVDTLATVNGFEHTSDFEPGMELIVPSAPGLYLYRDSATTWMNSLREELKDTPSMSLVINRESSRHEADYFSGINLPAANKTRFILPMFASPLERRVITSPFGYRNHPFTGNWELHRGTDYRAAMNSSVFSCGDGTVLSTGELADYGKYIIISHRNGYTSLYGHLDRILVRRNQRVLEGEIIAESGNTGISTGPHLHFEIRKNGSPVDPENLLLKDG